MMTYALDLSRSASSLLLDADQLLPGKERTAVGIVVGQNLVR